VVMPGDDSHTTGLLEARVVLAVGGHCDHYALEVSAAE
jgi:hypothetical protein